MHRTRPTWMAHMRRTVVLPLALAVVVPGGAWIAQATAAGGLTMTPAVAEQTAAKGAIAPVTLRNTSTSPLKITVTPRPWVQSKTTGAVVPDRKKTLLKSVGVNVRSFSLPAGATRTVTLSVKSVPKSGSLYGGIEVIGLPPKTKKKNGITAAYRLVGSLRLNPKKSRYSLRASSAAVSRGRITLPVKNAGNTIAPITGTVRLKSARGSRTVTIAAQRVLPGATVAIALGSTKGLPAGSYTATISLVQGGKKVLGVSRGFRL